jgi:outer membrane protein OmpA-like peptidoglycan-associated protein
MSNTSRILIILAILLLYTLGLFRFCSREICESCGINGTAATTAVDTSATNRFPIGFRWSDITPVQGPGFDSLKAAVMAGMSPDSILQITGLYFENEAPPTGYENMGLARAAQIRDKFFSNIPEKNIRLRARLVDEAAGVRDNYFAASEFDWLPKKEIITETVEELQDAAIIRFPFNSVEKDYDPKVEAYLAKLAKRVAQTGESITLTGHTDNVDDDAFNMQLGDRRAKQIRDILIRLGVKKELITTSSKGKRQPVAPNSTEEGRHNNRRVEVRLIKKK